MYTVIENTPGYMPEDDEPFVGTWDECCEVMDDEIARMVEQGYTVTHNEGVGFRLAGGTRQTWLASPDASAHDLGRVIEIVEDRP